MSVRSFEKVSDEKVDIKKEKKKRKTERPRRLRMNNGGYIPVIQLGTYRMKKPLGPCKNALSIVDVRDQVYSYGGLDTASIYNNEDGVGQAVRAVANKGPRTREEIFVQTKLWRSQQGNGSNGKPKVAAALRASLRKLGLEYVDLWLMHWPGPGRHLSKPPVRKCTTDAGWQSMKREEIVGNDEITVPKDWTPAMRLQTWKEMAELTGKDKSVRAIGVCNFSERQLTELLAFCDKEKIIKPAVVQNECHPHLPATKVRKLCTEHGIVFQAYSSLGAGSSSLMNAKEVTRIAKKCAKTPAQVLLRWAVQHGLTIVPKTTSKDRLTENARIFDFELSTDDMTALDNLSTVEVSQNTMFGWRREFDPDHY